MATDLKVGDRVSRRYGPFQSIWEVVRVIEAGAALNYIGPVVYVGYDEAMWSPDGKTQLTETPREDFVGRAHWPSVEVVT